MVTGNFTPYDLLVDIVPGVVMLGFAGLVLPLDLTTVSGNTGTALLSGLFLAATAYALGRVVIHRLSGWLLKDCLREKAVQNAGSQLSDPPKGWDPIDLGLREEFAELKNVPQDLQRDILHQLRRRVDSDHPETLRRHGETILYRKQTLYGKYNSLATLCRQLTLVFLIGSVMLTGYAVLLCYDYEFGLLYDLFGGSDSRKFSFFLLAAFVFLFASLSYGYSKRWITARTYSFFHELSIEFTDSRTIE